MEPALENRTKHFSNGVFLGSLLLLLVSLLFEFGVIFSSAERFLKRRKDEKLISSHKRKVEQKMPMYLDVLVPVRAVPVNTTGQYHLVWEMI